MEPARRTLPSRRFLDTLRARVRFDRNELAGSFGDLGTDFPLILGMILAARLDVASALVMFGGMQVLTGMVYGLPMPVQPLKAMAAIVITQRLPASVLYGGGLAVGLIMLFLTVTGLLDRIAVAVPRSVIRGIQFGLGLQLTTLALREFVPAEGNAGFLLAAVAFALVVWLLGNRRYPPAILLVVIGVLFALAFRTDLSALAQSVGFRLPRLHVPTWADITTGLVLLALPQIALSLGNSVLATRQIVQDLFPDRPITYRKIGFTYALMNLVNPFLGGIPTCHGSGGMAGHYTFGARTGGSVVLEGSFYILMGAFFAAGFEQISLLFPKPILGVILFFEGLVMMRFVRDQQSRGDFTIALIVGLFAVGLPYGYLVGLVVGTLLHYLGKQGWLGLTR